MELEWILCRCHRRQNCHVLCTAIQVFIFGFNYEVRKMKITSSFGKVQFEFFHVSIYSGAKEFQQNKRRRRTTNTGSEEGGLQIFGWIHALFHQWWLDLLIRLLLQWQLCEISLRRKNNLAAKKSRDARRVSLLCKTELSLDETEGPLQISHKKDANWCQKLVFMTMRLRWEKINCGCAFYALKTPTVF